MSEINPNTPVTAQDPINQNSPDIPASFDELEAALAKPRSKSKQARESEEAETKKETKSEGSKDLTDDRQKSETKKSDDKKESKSEKKPDAEKKDDGKEKAKEDLEAKAKKAIKAKRGDEDLDLDEDVLFTVKVNGKEEPVTLKDLMGNYSGKVGYDKKFSELDKERRTWQGKYGEVEAKIKSIFEEQDADKRWYHMASLAGADPVQYRQQYLNDNLKLLEKYYSMTEDERKAEALEFERNYYKHQTETKDTALKTEHAKQALKSKIDGLLATHKIPAQDFVSYHDQIEDAVRAGKLDKAKVTPEFIVETIQKDKLWEAAAPTLEASGFDETTKAKKLLDLVETAHSHGLTPEDTAELASELWGSKKKNKVIEEKVREREEFMTGKKDSLQATPMSATFFEDII